jgi:hypothetical protein
LRPTSVTDYAQLLDVIMRRMAELSVPYDVLDETAGLPARYSQKILGLNPCKRFGEISLGCILGALGLRLVVMPDPEALHKVERRLRARQLRHAVTRHKTAVAAPGAAAGESISPAAI